MYINPLKTKCMLIGSNRRLKHSPKLTLNVENHLIDNVSSQIVMGISIENNLQWNSQINNVCRKLNMKVNLFKRFSPFLTMDMKKPFYYSYILSQFDYCCVV